MDSRTIAGLAYLDGSLLLFRRPDVAYDRHVNLSEESIENRKCSHPSCSCFLIPLHVRPVSLYPFRYGRILKTHEYAQSECAYLGL